MTIEEIERTVTALRQSYAQMRSFYSPHGRYRALAEHDKLWEKIAPTLLERGINPYHFVKTTFEFHLYELRKPAAWVKEVASMKAIDRYMERHSDRDRELRLLLRLQLETVRVLMQQGRSVEDIIKDTTLELNVVVRYALARKFDHTELAKKLLPDASLDINYEPVYQQFLDQMIGAEQRHDGTG